MRRTLLLLIFCPVGSSGYGSESGLPLSVLIMLVVGACVFGMCICICCCKCNKGHQDADGDQPDYENQPEDDGMYNNSIGISEAQCADENPCAFEAPPACEYEYTYEYDQCDYSFE